MRTKLLYLIIFIITGTVYAQNVNIPDANFKAVLLANSAINTNNDGEIQLNEASAFTGVINVVNKNIIDLTGIGAFDKITGLFCNNNGLTHLDVSRNTNLTSIDCSQNNLTNLNVSKNIALQSLAFSSNSIDFIKVTTNIALEQLIGNNNILGNLVVNNNPLLKHLDIGSNNLNELNVNDNPVLEYLHCGSNNLTHLNTSQNTILKHLFCDGNFISSIDISANTILEILVCSHNNLTQLELANGNNADISMMFSISNPNLTCIKIDPDFKPRGNWVKDMSANYNVECSAVHIPDANFKTALLANRAINTNKDNEIQTTEATAFRGSIDVNSKNIKDLTGIEAFKSLTGLFCNNNNLRTLNVSSNTILRTLECRGNLLRALDVTSNQNLTHLDCADNGLSSLEVSKNTNMTYLRCTNNNLESLEVSANTFLTDLDCSANGLTVLDVSNNTALVTLTCSINKISDLDLSANYNLEQLSCIASGLTSLDLANGSSSLSTMNATNNLDLTCIQIDSGFTPPSGWHIDGVASYNKDCSGTQKIGNSKKSKYSYTIIYSSDDVKDQISVLTNPTGKLFDLEKLYNKIRSIEFYNLSGQRVRTTNKTTINVQSLEKGIYILKIKRDEGELTTTKFIKK